MRSFLNQPLWIRVLRGILLAAVLAGVAFVVPTPYVLHAPGPANEVRKLIRISDAEVHPSRGSFLLPTVLEEPATLLYCVYGWMDPEADLIKGEGRPPQAQSPDGQMKRSQYLATRVALEALDYTVPGQCIGLRVLNLLPDSPNEGVLRPGDILLEADGQELRSTRALHRITSESSLQIGLPVKLERDGVTLNLELSLYQPDGRARIGAYIGPEFADQSLPLDVNFLDDGTMGASGGLVFGLEIYDQLTSEDLTGGRRIAATGVMEGDGSVAPVQGVSYKLVGVERAGADVFLIPRDNWDEIKNTRTSVKVVPVSNFKEALKALR